MPRRRSQSTKRAVVLGIVAVLFGLAMIAGVAVLFGRGRIDPKNLGDRDFRVGRTDRLAREIADRGPFLIPDASPNHARPIYITHGGTDVSTQWLAILAFAPGETDPKCALQWRGKQYQDPCSGTAYPADGTGLTRYATRVEGAALYVDLRTTLP
jgi:hypothetical protein